MIQKTYFIKRKIMLVLAIAFAVLTIYTVNYQLNPNNHVIGENTTMIWSLLTILILITLYVVARALDPRPAVILTETSIIALNMFFKTVEIPYNEIEQLNRTKYVTHHVGSAILNTTSTTLKIKGKNSAVTINFTLMANNQQFIKDLLHNLQQAA